MNAFCMFYLYVSLGSGSFRSPSFFITLLNSKNSFLLKLNEDKSDIRLTCPLSQQQAAKIVATDKIPVHTSSVYKQHESFLCRPS